MLIRRLFVIAFLAVSYEGQAQGFGAIDTVFTLQPGQQYGDLQAYNDTVYFRADRDNTYDYLRLYGSGDGGDSWSIVIDSAPGGRPCLTNSASLIGLGRGAVQGDLRMWILRGFDIVLDTNLTTTSFRGRYGMADIRFHRTDPNIIFAKVDYYGVRYDYYGMFASTDAGRTWNEIKLPVELVGWGKLIEWRHNYADPTGWTFFTSTYDGFDPYWYFVTHDSGQTYTKSAPVHWALHGYFKPHTWLKATPGHTFDYEPVLMDTNEAPVDSLHWFGNMKASLPYDTAKYDFLQTMSLSLESLLPRNFAYALVNRGVFAGRVYLEDRLEPDKNLGLTGTVATKDSGRTWKWLVEPAYDAGLSDVVLDPVTGTFYVATTGTNVRDQPRVIRILRIKQNITSVASAGPTASARVFPIPAESSVTISMPFAMGHNIRAELWSATGQSHACTIESISQGHLTTDIVLNVGAFPSGYYTIRIVDREVARCYPLVVSH